MSSSNTNQVLLYHGYVRGGRDIGNLSVLYLTKKQGTERERKESNVSLKPTHLMLATIFKEEVRLV